MASTVDVSALTLNQEELKDVSKAIYELAFVLSSSNMSELHTIQTGIKWKEQIAFLGQLGLIGQATGAACVPNTETNAAAITDKTWDPTKIGFRLIHCADDLDKDFKLFKRQMKALEWYDETTDEVIGFITARSLEAMQQMLFRFAWFGDTAADNVSGGGVITNGVDVGYFDAVDGFWAQIFADGNIPTVVISENAGVSYAAQMALADGKAKDTMQAMHEAADPRLLASPNARFYVTRSLAQNFYTYLEDSSLGFTLAITEDGKKEFSYRGIPVSVMYEWDRLIQAYQDNGTTYNLPHRALLTTPENLPIGVLDTESMDKLDVFYDKVEKKNYIDAEVQIDFKVLESHMIVAAYPGS